MKSTFFLIALLAALPAAAQQQSEMPQVQVTAKEARLADTFLKTAAPALDKLGGWLQGTYASTDAATGQAQTTMVFGFRDSYMPGLFVPSLAINAEPNDGDPTAGISCKGEWWGRICTVDVIGFKAVCEVEWYSNDYVCLIED